PQSHQRLRQGRRIRILGTFGFSEPPPPAKVLPKVPGAPAGASEQMFGAPEQMFGASEQNVWRRLTTPRTGAERLRSGTANECIDGGCGGEGEKGTLGKRLICAMARSRGSAAATHF